ncbi:transmembrane protein 237 [Nematostella vectensis]|uniref:transmembrane protein 237 n=1 Tax=Nematostella vectensis TaxID=45351 RepID=UPI001390483A|nr:transmembrane protein 237 [Nematostella vectensis]
MDREGPIALAGPATTGLPPRERSRRRKKRMSRDFDEANESLESPSSLQDRVPLHEMAEGERSNASPEDGSLGHEGRTSRSRDRTRRTKHRASRNDNGEFFNGDPSTQMHSLQLPEKKRHKRPPPGPRHARRSASAEVINRLDGPDEMDGENMSPTRRRNRRRRAHGSRDFMDGEEVEEYMVDGEPLKRPKPHKHKSRKANRQQNQATSGEEENYNADLDGEVSMVDYYKVDKEDLVVADSSLAAPPPNPSIAQTLPSQPLDIVFIQNRDGHGFRSERKARMTQLDSERKDASPVNLGHEQTTAEFAVSVHRAYRSFALFCHGLLAGFALCQCIFVYSLSTHGDTVFLTYYSKLALPVQSLYYMLFALCTVSVFDRYDMANPRSGFFHGLLTRPSRILSISAYLFALVFSISVANIDDRISLHNNPPELWGSKETTSLLDTWRIINLMRVLGAALGWVLVALQPTKDYTAENLYEGNLLGNDKTGNHYRPTVAEHYTPA